MTVIEQENVQTKQTNLSSLGNLHISDDSFFDDFSFTPGFNMNRQAPSNFFSSKSTTSSTTSNSGKDQWVIVDDPISEKPKTSFAKPGNIYRQILVRV